MQVMTIQCLVTNLGGKSKDVNINFKAKRLLVRPVIRMKKGKSSSTLVCVSCWC